MNNFSFKGIWIPADVLELIRDKKITPTDMVLLSMIFALSKNGEGCYASREYLAEVVGLSVDHIKRLISKYRKMGLIVDLEFDGRRQKIRTYWDEGWHTRHGRRGVDATAEIASGTPSSTRGGVDATADQAINSINRGEIAPTKFLEGIKEYLYKEFELTPSALERATSKYLLYCDDKGRRPSVSGLRLWLGNENWDMSDYSPAKQNRLNREAIMNGEW